MKFDRASVIIAAIMMTLELLLGIGLLGGIALLIAVICIVTYVIDRKNFPGLLGTALPFAIVVLLTISWLSFNWRIAERRAGPIIAACEDYHRRNGQYPKSLDQLVPQFLPSIPVAKDTIVANKFGYAQEPASLYFAAMFHGVVTYDFQSHKWWTND